MASLLWVALPYGAFLSFVLGHVWWYRRDGFRSYTRSPEMDRTERFGTMAFRTGVGLVVVARVASVITAQPQARPAGAIHAVIMTVQIVGLTTAAIGAVLLFIPDLISGTGVPAITPIDRITFPALTAALLSGVFIEFGHGEREYRRAETLFAWFRSLFTIDPYPEAMAHAPLIYQARGLILLLIIGIWPYTRLAGIFAGPITRLILRALPRRGLDGAITRA